MIAMIETLPDEAFGLPGGEEDWTVAETIGHAASARSGLVMAAALAAAGRWPADTPAVVPGVAGPSGLDRADLVRKIDQSQRIIARPPAGSPATRPSHARSSIPSSAACAAASGCSSPGVHDLMHLEQLHAIADDLAAGPVEK